MSDILKHRFVSPKLDGTDPTQVQPSAWNDGHRFVGGADGDLLTRATADADFGAIWAASSIGTVQPYSVAWQSAAGAPPAIGNGTLDGRYTTVGDLVWANITLVWGSTTTGGGGGWVFGLPVLCLIAPTSVQCLGNVLVGPGFAYSTMGCYVVTTNTINPFSGPPGASQVSMDATHPAVWSPGNSLNLFLMYRKV